MRGGIEINRYKNIDLDFLQTMSGSMSTIGFGSIEKN